MRLALLTVTLALAACARASGGSADATETIDDAPVVIDAMADANGCATQPCSIFPQCGCGGNNACDIASSLMGTSCRMITTPGKETGACSTPRDCDRGYVCLGGTGASCHKYCNANTDCTGPRGQCVIEITSGGNVIPNIPPACSSNCDPTSTNPAECPSTHKCGLFTATKGGTQVKISGCSLAGTGVQGTSCKVGTAGDDSLCGKGFLCTTLNAGTDFNCRRMCQRAPAGAACPTGTCIGFTTPHTINGVEYGVCN